MAFFPQLKVLAAFGSKNGSKCDGQSIIQSLESIKMYVSVSKIEGRIEPYVERFVFDFPRLPSNSCILYICRALRSPSVNDGCLST